MLYRFFLKPFLLLFPIVLFACHSIEDKSIKNNHLDIAQIVTKIVNGKLFLDENKQTDTLFFLKNGFYNNSWPHHTPKFKLVFIENNSRSRMFNIGPGFPHDARQRLSIVKFSHRNDTCTVAILENGSNLFYDAKLLYKNKEWRLIEEQVRVGGRAEKFEFENEKWYKNWKQKINKQ